ncbi:nitroreductase family protein [Alkalihalophilus lindianensis]|uniref:Nitroreductase family protein n=1 Tax=Alkalihalophilus lindianensis TaxID=1630542 RepID=A0ABU3X8H8_9BACI|nr:nitroreductase family protein [Alkalihalophilus lindianensis]MDV2683744.1 nitroreductase family protein [Alkalihalophilus lindianensis]
MHGTTHQEELGLFQTIEERHSVRKYEAGYEMPAEDLTAILEAAAMAPSSWNLQHWRFLVIEDQKKKEELLPIAYNQKQIVDSSVTIAVLGDLEANKEADAVYGAAVENGFMTEQIKDTLVGQINQAYEGDTPFPRDEAVLNASLAAMQLMLAAKAKGYDTCPMGGFNRDAFVKSFNVPDRFTPVMLLTVGKAAMPAHRSARKPLEEVTIRNSF